jgi:hypothetical protein
MGTLRAAKDERREWDNLPTFAEDRQMYVTGSDICFACVMASIPSERLPRNDRLGKMYNRPFTSDNMRAITSAHCSPSYRHQLSGKPYGVCF